VNVSVSRTFFTFTFLSQLNEEENREDIAASPEGSTSGESSSDSGGSSSSDDGSDGEQAPEQRTIPRRWMLRTEQYVRTLGEFEIACTFM
jgi:hypothetical protein